MSVGVYVVRDQWGNSVIIKSYIIEGRDMDFAAIRARVPGFVCDTTLKRRLARGVNTWALLCRHPKDVMASNGKRSGNKFNQTWRAQKQASVEAAARNKQRKENHGW